MNEKELWKYFLERQAHVAKTPRHTLVWVKKHDFEAVKENFMQEFNILHAGSSYRSRGFFLHIHCIEQGDYVLVHRDVANVARFLPLGIIHFFIDVLPYIILAWIKRVSFNSFFTMPH